MKRTSRWRVLLAAIVILAQSLGLWLTPSAKGQAVPEATPQPGQEAWLDALMATMTPADKVGQLFLVTFRGSSTQAGSDIARLVQELRVGGVLIAPENENFSNDAAAPAEVLTLTRGLQQLAFSASAPSTITSTVPVTITAPTPAAGEPSIPSPEVLSAVVTVTQQITYPAQGIPLLIAVLQEGDGYPFTALRTGFTELPSLMALGASWHDENAEEVGRIVGQELAAVGVNLLLGPSLDVLVEPRAGLSDHLSTRVFGGDPFWAGRMGRAYIRGVHEGSRWRVATVAKHLPGLGGSDRSLEEEVATIDKSLQDLRLIELPPFFAVTQTEPVTDTTDALMTAHIRYRGFQGNIRYVTPPISLHAQGMDQILGLEELLPWRQQGGLLVSDSLGVPAIRRYFSPTLDSFPNRQIALDAFLAGNDVLNLARFSLTDSWDEQMRNLEDTILFFRSRYAEDDSFRARVEQSVRRILKLKRRICPDFELSACTPTDAGLSTLGSSQQAIAAIAKQATTLLYPALDELALRVPRPPRQDEQIVIFTDAREAQECAQCPPIYLLDPNLIRDTMLRLYGPQATGQVSPERIVSLTYSQLQGFLTSGKPDLNVQLREADWIVFAMLNVDAVQEPSSAALKQFLKERATAAEPQKIIVLAYEAPYYLDTTEVSKLTAYYGMYSKSLASVETSIRALFQEYRPGGRSPITVEGVGYDLVKQLSPDPAQVIAVLPAEEHSELQLTPEALSLQVGDSLEVRTSVILDRNGHPVPDATPVIFRYVYQGEGLGGQKEAFTIDGVARSTITLEREGELLITATSEPARSSTPLVVRLSGGTSQILTPTPAPSPTPTDTPTATPTDTPSPTPLPTATPEPQPTPAPFSPPPQPRVLWIDLVFSLLGMLGAGAVVYAVGRRLNLKTQSWNPALRLALWSGVCGLLGYLFYGLALPGSSFLEGVVPGLRGLVIGLACGLLPLAALAWMHWRSGQRR